MTAFVVFIIIACILLLLFIPLHLYIDYNGKEVRLCLRYLFVKVQLLPQKKKKKPEKKKEPMKKPAPKKQEPEKESFIKRLVKANGIGGVIDILKEAVEILNQLLGSITKHILIKKLKINIVTGGDDAANTAMNFGYACNAVYPALGTISALTKLCCVPDVKVHPDFDSKKSEAALFASTAIRPIFVIIPVIVEGIKALKLYFKVNETL